MLERKASPAGHSCSSLELKTRLTGFPFLSLFFFFFGCSLHVALRLLHTMIPRIHLHHFYDIVESRHVLAWLFLYLLGVFLYVCSSHGRLVDRFCGSVPTCSIPFQSHRVKQVAYGNSSASPWPIRTGERKSRQLKSRGPDTRDVEGCFCKL